MLLNTSLLLFILSIFLFVNSLKTNKNSVYLTSFFIITALYGVVHYFTIYAKSAYWLAIFYSHFSPLFLLLGPLLYLYTRNTLLDRERFSWRDSLHGIPMLVHLIGLIPYFIKPFSYKLAIAHRICTNLNLLLRIDICIFYSATFSYFMRVGLMLCYVIFNLYLLWKHKNKDQYNKRMQSQLIFKWLLLLNTLVLLLTLYFLILTIMGKDCQSYDYILKIHPLHIAMGLLYLFLALSLLFFPNILYGIPIQKPLQPKPAPAHKAKKSPKAQRNASTNGLMQLHDPEDPMYSTAEAIREYLIENKPFLDPDFSPHQMAIDLKIPLNHISYCFAYIFQKKFNELKTELRVNHARQLLSEGLNEKLTIDAIGQQAGFSSRSNFYISFKKITNSTPTEFVAHLQQQDKTIDNKEAQQTGKA